MSGLGLVQNLLVCDCACTEILVKICLLVWEDFIPIKDTFWKYPERLFFNLESGQYLIDQSVQYLILKFVIIIPLFVTE